MPPPSTSPDEDSFLSSLINLCSDGKSHTTSTVPIQSEFKRYAILAQGAKDPNALSMPLIWWKKLAMTARQQKDSHALGILALSLNLLVTSLPAEVSTSCIAAIDEAGLPSTIIKGNDSDSGYTLDLSNGPLYFSTAERVPSEGYISQNYEVPIHTDQLYASYAMNWVTLHSIVDPEQCQLHGDCSSGGNDVDVSLQVVVKCATDTVMSMQPKFKHGTTLAQEGVCRQGTAINFSRHIKNTFDKAIAIEGDVKAMVTQLVEEKNVSIQLQHHN
ncbi:uncharacterized protein EDB93DRAFT_1255918 [Suillus bovinus]|uniref:uncharacterized protein n=1 Tax=Suillus bovinus TaxID=48563 RepID=UPI001B868090|nr:uncharacterized protein EDB93DRAFT_1255918 [Suillus bovinus]KAG2130433.1 hypothetical protein EDB93DRAFT_1255918 [Suillus bovinus]